MRATARHWHRHDDPQGITWLWLDKAGERANTLSAEVLRELDAQLEDLHRREPRGVVIGSRKDSGFILGADIREFGKLSDEQQAFEQVREGQKILDRIERLRCPTVAMIRGYALGGGLELAMACRYRLCADTDKSTLGLPEVRLGLHPGFGGTIRAVRLLGAPAAMNLILSGRSLRPRKARALGLVDRVVPDEEEALEDAARRLIQRPPRPRRAPAHLRLLNLPGVRSLLALVMRRQVSRQARAEHYPAPYAALDLWQRHGARARGAYEAEARSIARLFMTPTAKNLIRVFFLRERMKKLGADLALEPVRHVHVVGAGVMGADIASWCARQGLRVTLQDRDPALIEKGRERARSQLGRRMPSSGVEEILERLQPDPHGDGAARADVIIEAIFEDLEAKRTVFAQLEKQAAATALLATNTSSIRLEDIASALSSPQRLIGLHFFNPVARLPLVEVIRGRQSSAEAVQRGLGFVNRIDKLPLPCASQPGFLVNRILMPYMAEAFQLAEEGVPLAQIDASALAFGMPMGPIELADNVGLDIALHVARILGAASGRPVPEILKRKVEAGQLGRKSGEGFYVYRNGKPQRSRLRLGNTHEELQDRLILPMVNEAVACHADGVVDEADLVDAGVIFGTGFAPFRGGPIQYARSRGLAETCQRLSRLAMRYGAHFEPHPGWSALNAMQWQRHTPQAYGVKPVES